MMAYGGYPSHWYVLDKGLMGSFVASKTFVSLDFRATHFIHEVRIFGVGSQRDHPNTKSCPQQSQASYQTFPDNQPTLSGIINKTRRRCKSPLVLRIIPTLRFLHNFIYSPKIHETAIYVQKKTKNKYAIKPMFI